MKKIILSLLMLCSMTAAWAADNKPEGEGTSASPYLIGTAEELVWFRDQVNANSDVEFYATLIADIDLSSLHENLGWEPIGSYTNGYRGTFDGQNHQITNLYITEGDYSALFRANKGTIRNLSVSGSVSGGAYSAGICSINEGTITRCHNMVNVEIAEMVAGGICATNSGEITFCCNTASVAGSLTIGGICGENTTLGTIANCYNNASVTATLGSNLCGGVSGDNATDGCITNCYSTGSIIEMGDDANVTNCSVVTPNQFASGEVAWLLNGETAQGELAWYQTLGAEGDASPVLVATGNNIVCGYYLHGETTIH